MKKIFHIALLSFFFFMISCQPSTVTDENSKETADRPNIVWIVTEDNSKHFLKLYQKDGVSMPNVESLAEKGIVFNNAFSNAPVCSVARSTIISGCYAPRTGAQYHRKMKEVPLPEGLEMFPAYLQRSGYYTTNNDKEDYNFRKPSGTWNESSKTADYHNRKKGQPFFHVQNFTTTHEGKLHFSKTEMLEDTLNLNKQNNISFPYHPDTPLFRYTYAKYYELHQKVDREIGKFIDQLASEGLMEHTIIFYFGDHGGVLPRSKGYVYESGLHVPLIVYIPEKYKYLCPLKPGTRTDGFVQFADFGPTVLNLAGSAVPDQMDGTPFLGKGISLENIEARNTVFCYADRFDEKYDLVRTFRKDNFKYIRNYQPFNIDGLFNLYRYNMQAYKELFDLYHAGKLNAVQQQFFQTKPAEALYDLQSDPHEVRNLAADPDYKNKLNELRTALQNQVKSMPDLSFFPESYFLENGMKNPVRFGQSRKLEIADLIDIADLSLASFEESDNKIQSALDSKNPWHRYWGLIVCSTHGKTAQKYYTQARNLAKSDAENLVRLRAAEFLLLNDQPINQQYLLDIIRNASSESEANLILNSVALIKTLKPDFRINIPDNYFKNEWIDTKNDLVSSRLTFLRS